MMRRRYDKSSVSVLFHFGLKFLMTTPFEVCKASFPIQGSYSATKEAFSYLDVKYQNCKLYLENLAVWLRSILDKNCTIVEDFICANKLVVMSFLVITAFSFRYVF